MKLFLETKFDLVPVMQVLKDATGGNKKVKSSEFLDSGHIAIVDQSSDCLISGYSNDKTLMFKTESPVIIFGDHTRVVKYIDFPFILGADGTKALIPRNQDENDAKFLYYQLKHLRIPSAGYSRHFKFLKEEKLAIPPLLEQQRIADILDKAEAINQKREQALSLCDEFLRATFLDMFGDPVSNPKGWDIERLESFILHMNNGLSRRRKVQENVGDIVLRLQDIQYDGIGFEKELNRVELDEDEKKRYKLLAGDILFVRVNGNPDYVGRSAIFNGYQEPVFHNDHLIRIRLNEKLLPEYLVFLLHSDVENNLISQQIKTSAGQHTISQKGINDIEIPIPSVELQQEFIAVVEKVNAIKARIQDAQELPLFDALSQQAFKGELTQ